MLGVDETVFRGRGVYGGSRAGGGASQGIPALTGRARACQPPAVMLGVKTFSTGLALMHGHTTAHTHVKCVGILPPIHTSSRRRHEEERQRALMHGHTTAYTHIKCMGILPPIHTSSRRRHSAYLHIRTRAAHVCRGQFPSFFNGGDERTKTRHFTPTCS